MLLLDQTLLKLAKGLWKWIIAIVAVRFLALIGIARFASAVGTYLGSVLSPGSAAVSFGEAVRSALIASLITLGAQLLQGELEYRCTAQARRGMRSSIFNKVLELDAGNIERIGPVSAITSSVEAVERMQTYYSTYLPAESDFLPDCPGISVFPSAEYFRNHSCTAVMHLTDPASDQQCIPCKD